MSKHTPIRTCIGCLKKRPQKELIRLGGGRGAYLCPNQECFEKAMKKKAFVRAFKREVSKEEVDVFKKEFEQQIKEFGQSAPGGHRDGPC